jgi:hypothetical protein
MPHNIFMQQIDARSNQAARPPNPRFGVFIKASEGVPAHEAITRANKAGVIIASNREITMILNGADEDAIHSIKRALACHTGTAFAHVSPGKRFREAAQKISSIDNGYYVVHTDENERWLYHILGEYIEWKDAILVCNHPNFDFFVDGKDRIIKPKLSLSGVVPGVVSDFPPDDGFYRPDPEYGIPHGRAVGRLLPDSLCPWRLKDNAVGLVARGCDSYDGGGGRVVGLDGRASSGLGVAVKVATSQKVSLPASEQNPIQVPGRAANCTTISPSLIRLSDAELLRLEIPGQTVIQYRDTLVTVMAGKAACALGLDFHEILGAVRKKLEHQPYVDLAQSVLDSISGLIDKRTQN